MEITEFDVFCYCGNEQVTLVFYVFSVFVVIVTVGVG
jgi:hypothetical protein